MQKIIVIRKAEELLQLKEYIGKNEYLAFDTETTGIDRESEIIGYSLSGDVETGYYVVTAYWDVELSKLVYLDTKDASKSIMESLIGKHLIMHNAGFDCQMVNMNYGVDLMPSLHTDTMILGHVLNENRHNGLKELGTSLFGASARKEQEEMKESVHKNGGLLTKAQYELYKGDSELIAKYGAKDAILTYQVFVQFIQDLEAEGLDKFFYDDESMPLLKGPTYELNTTGLRVDADKLQTLKSSLEAECMELKSFIYREIEPHIAEEYPGTSKAKTFNIGSSKQLAWLLFHKLGNPFNTLTESGRELCHALNLKLPYALSDKREFIRTCTENPEMSWCEPVLNVKTGKMGRPKKIAPPWHYMACDKATLVKLSTRYKWVEKFLKYNKNLKILNTYVEGIQERMKYGIIRPSFLQHGTTSGRYSSRNPNFQNLPRDDKRIKACIISRPGKVFVGADYSQLEPRVFASFSKDKRLLESFRSGDDFYSVIGMEVFEKYDCKPTKEDFGTKYKKLRDIAKVVALSSTYGTTAPKMAPTIGKSIEEAQEVIDSYFTKFPSVLELMESAHEEAKATGKVYNLFGRPRRMPEAMAIPKHAKHSDLKYDQRNLLNLAINHRIQSTGASIMNRAAINFWHTIRELGIKNCHIVLQVHDELVVECLEADAPTVKDVLKYCMENTVVLPGVDLIAEPVIASNLADLK